jgi:hypothetical protein
VREQVQGHLVGPVLAALRAWVGPGASKAPGVRTYVPGLQRGAARPRARGGDGDGDVEVEADGGAERARGAGDLHARRALHRPRAGVASFFWPGRGRGRASSAAACPSLGGRTPISFTTALILSYLSYLLSYLSYRQARRLLVPLCPPSLSPGIEFRQKDRTSATPPSSVSTSRKTL